MAGAVLAAILVPQGMAYAELAGLPAVTGLYTTIACLIGYAAFGPSRVLVLGPDSSISPLILAAITPLLVTEDPASAIALAGMLAVLVGLTEIGLGLGKLGFVADLLSKEVQVGYMNGLAITIIIGQLPKLFGFSTHADSFLAEIRAFADSLDQTHTTTLIVGVAVLVLLLVLPRITTRLPAILVAVVGATVASAVFGLDGKGVATVGALPQGIPAPTLPWTNAGDVVPLLIAAVGITLVSLDRHDRDRDELRGAARRRGRAQPGDDRDGRGEHRRGALPGLRGIDQRLPDRGGRTVQSQEPAHRRRGRGPGRGAPAVPELAACRPAANGARRRRDRRRAVADGRVASCAATCAFARARSPCRSSRPPV